MALSRKHFCAVVEIIRNLSERPAKEEIASAFANYFRGENINFDRGRFLDACEPVEEMKPCFPGLVPNVEVRNSKRS